MAINSPGVTTVEKDLTFNVQSVTSNATGYVGMFRWGPANQVVDITTNESELVARFGQPDSNTTQYFHAASNYMLYSVPLSIVRVVGDAAVNASTGLTSIVVNNDDDYESVSLTGHAIIGRYPGDMVNGVTISAATAEGYGTWAYANEFQYVPSGEQMNLVVVDTTGLISGTVNTVLERYELMSLTPGAKKGDGTTGYLVEAVKNQSKFILIGDTTELETEIVAGLMSVTLANGVDDNVAANADFVSGWAEFESKETVEMVRVFTAFNPVEGIIKAIDVCDTRLDSVAFHACQLSDVYNTTDRTDKLKTYFGTTVNKPTSYAFQVDNWKMVYDKYNDKNIWIPCDSDAAGLHARVFVQNEPWFSPAGFNRGQLKNVIKLAWTSNEAQRDVLYPNAINSIVAFKGEGTVLFGDKTALMAPSAFSRINVRSLFIVIKKAIARAARYQLFEQNDFITQGIFKGATDRYLDDIKNRRGLTDKRVVCDSTNNTPQVLQSNQFVGSIFAKPTYSINNIRLDFVAVGAGVSFEEIEGV